MKRLLILFFCIFSIIAPILKAQQYEQTQVYCSKELKPFFYRLQTIPEVDALVKNILKDGPLSIKTNRHLSKKFGGYWNASDRTIYITKSKSAADMTSTLLFEMHNAVNDKQLEKLDNQAMHQSISRKDYIKGVECVEYQNAKATEALLNKGIRSRILSPECRWSVPSTFDEHFAAQQSTGHSAFIGETYDQYFR